MITDVPGIKVGHWTDEEARTGCTVVLLPAGTVASGEVRGGAPAEREMALLEPSRLVNQLDALVLTGGSAFGLASADGVMRWCEEQGRGVATEGGAVPIVVGLALFDLDVGDAAVRPSAAEGYAAASGAQDGRIELGRVGAAAGARVDRVAALVGTGEPRPGGLVSATVRAGEVVVSTLVAVNAVGAPGGDDRMGPALAKQMTGRPSPLGNTTIGLVATNAELDKAACLLVAQAAHNGLARSLFPSHTRYDGDAFVAASVGGAEADVEVVRLLTVAATSEAIRSLA